MLVSREKLPKLSSVFTFRRNPSPISLENIFHTSEGILAQTNTKRQRKGEQVMHGSAHKIHIFSLTIWNTKFLKFSPSLIKILGVRQQKVLLKRANKIGYKLTWSENALKAGIGIKAAIKKAVTLLIDVRATLAPVCFRHSPVLSCKTNDVS